MRNLSPLTGNFLNSYFKKEDCSQKEEERQCNITLLSRVGQSECLFHQKVFNFKDMKPRVSFSDLLKPRSYPLVTAHPMSATLNLSC